MNNTELEKNRSPIGPNWPRSMKDKETPEQFAERCEKATDSYMVNLLRDIFKNADAKAFPEFPKDTEKIHVEIPEHPRWRKISRKLFGMED